ncbi:transketolase C-terminal domain-containing protein [Thalassospiraceae bacterium LMO-JJ14]|nr:transketolase C-terminal domain-containing protein [Thalassospiraceae bacterium LMO-JJ14]
MKIDKRNAKAWSRIGSRAAFGLGLLQMAEDRDNLIVVAADTSTSAGLDRYRKTFPEKYLEVGIAEQNVMAISAGLASEGMNTVCATFAPFQTMRCCEQIKVNLGYMQHKVTFVGLASGVVLGQLGYSHCCIEDLAVMRAIPNLTVLSPADCGETLKALAAALDAPGPVYIRLTGGTPNPMVYEDDYDFEIGKSIRLRDGDDVAIIATGTMVNASLEAAEHLAEDGISAAVVNMHTIKPIDRDEITALCGTHKLIVTVEEHTKIGGLGSAVAEVKSAIDKAPAQLILGLDDSYAKSGAYVDILEFNGLTPALIARDIKSALG